MNAGINIKLSREWQKSVYITESSEYPPLNSQEIDFHLAIFQVIPGDCSFSILQWWMKQFRPVLSKQVLKLQKLKYSSILFFLEINPYNYYCNSNALNAHWMLTLYTLIKIQSEVGFIIPSVQTRGLKCRQVKSLCQSYIASWCFDTYSNPDLPIVTVYTLPTLPGCLLNQMIKFRQQKRS